MSFSASGAYLTAISVFSRRLCFRCWALQGVVDAAVLGYQFLRLPRRLMSVILFEPGVSIWGPISMDEFTIRDSWAFI